MVIIMYEKIKEQAKLVIKEIIEKSKIKSGEVLVVGCSSSEVVGADIGTDSNFEAAKNIFSIIYEILNENGIYLAAQCCEHLNRCLITEYEVAQKLDLTMVNAVPQIKAGGSFATVTYQTLKNPVAVENIKANAGIDIGGTLIGMHILPIAVPIKLSIKKIGDANVTAARSRLKFVGGERAVYNQNLM